MVPAALEPAVAPSLHHAQLLPHQLLSESIFQRWRRGVPSSLRCHRHIVSSLRGPAVRSSAAGAVETSPPATDTASTLTPGITPSRADCLGTGREATPAGSPPGGTKILAGLCGGDERTRLSQALVHRWFCQGPLSTPVKPPQTTAPAGRQLSFLPSPTTFQLGYWESQPGSGF